MSEKKLRIMSGILLVISVIIFGIFQYKEKVGKDQSGPVFSVESDTITISVKDDESALMSGITASDAKDGDLTSSIFIEDVSAFTEKKARWTCRLCPETAALFGLYAAQIRAKRASAVSQEFVQSSERNPRRGLYRRRPDHKSENSL